MRTNIEIDDKLMEEALRSTGSKTKKEVVETALKLLIQTRGQVGLRSLKGILKDDRWDGNLEEMRLSRFPDTWDEK